jgi:ppGpp synthetase/RelA/SpoT-type nucleotidyltranferase
MDPNALKSDYHKFSDEYSKFQNELEIFKNQILLTHKDVIDVEEVRQRPGSRIKTFESLLNNYSRGDKYIKFGSLCDIKDIAGVRITCYCEDDYTQLEQILDGAFKTKYNNVSIEHKDGYGSPEKVGKSKKSYRAIHFNLSKTITKYAKKYEIYAEVQLRTVMGHAWAILDRKYVYGAFEEGEPTELTLGTSAIMEGCEKIWSVVKKHKQIKDSHQEPKTTEDVPLNLITQTQEAISKITNKQYQKLPINWLDQHKATAAVLFKKYEIPGFMEVTAIPSLKPFNSISKKNLLEYSRKSQIHTFGWPIGVYLDREDCTPAIDSEGIHAEVPIMGFEDEYGKKEKVCDYWAIHLHGTFYTKMSLFEDTRTTGEIYFNTRIIRITESFMYINNLYSQLGFPDNLEIDLSVTHGGLQSRKLTATRDRFMFNSHKYRSNDGGVYGNTQTVSLNDIKTNMPKIVGEFTRPFFEMFDGFEISEKILSDIVNNYLQGKVT